jgi:hypothetical protein
MAEARLCPQCGEEPSADAPAGLAPMQIGGRLPETQSFSRTHRKSTQLREWCITSLRPVRLRTAIQSTAAH